MRDISYTTIAQRLTMVGTPVMVRARSAPRAATVGPTTDSTPSAVAEGT